MMYSAEQEQELTTTVRPLGFAEARMHLMQTRFSGTTQAAAVLQISGALDAQALRRAVKRLRDEHEILNVEVRRVAGALWFCRRPPLQSAPLTELEREDAGHWVRLLEHYNSRALDAQLGMWHIFLLHAPPEEPQVHELVLLSHHSIIDGAATRALFAYLLSETTSPRSGRANASRALAPAAEGLNRNGLFSGHKLSWGEFEQRQARLAEAQAGVAFLSHAASAPLATRVTRVIPLVPSAESCQALLDRVEGASVSVNSYLAAIFLLALEEHLPTRQRVALSTAISLREQAKEEVSAEDLGCYLSVVTTVHELGRAPSDVVQLAKEHQRSLLAAALTQGRNPGAVDLEQLERSLTAAAQADKFVSDFGMTFVEMPFGRYGSLEATAFYSSANRSMGTSAAVLHVAKLGKRLFLTLNYTSPLQSTAWANELAQSLIRRLQGNAPLR